MLNCINHSLFRFAMNGLVATGVHYLVMLIAIQILHITMYSLAYAFAFFFGVTASFLGNKYFVFRRKQSQSYQFFKFITLYIVLLLFTSITMWAVSDYAGFHYDIGFMVAAILQFIGGYLGSRYLIFYD